MVFVYAPPPLEQRVSALQVRSGAVDSYVRTCLHHVCARCGGACTYGSGILYVSDFCFVSAQRYVQERTAGLNLDRRCFIEALPELAPVAINCMEILRILGGACSANFAPMSILYLLPFVCIVLVGPSMRPEVRISRCIVDKRSTPGKT